MNKSVFLFLFLGSLFSLLRAEVVYGVSGTFSLGSATTSIKAAGSSKVKGFDINICPNPFNPVTRVSFHLMQTASLNVTVFNLKGERVRMLVNRTVQAGTHVLAWDGKDDTGLAVGSGVYLVRANAGQNVRMRNVTFLK